MKRLISIFLLITIVFSVFGCKNKSDKKASENEDITQAETSDLEINDTEETDTEAAQTESTENEVEKESAFSSYIGKWIDKEIDPNIGGAGLEISIEGDEMTVMYSLSNISGIARTAFFEVKTNISDIKDNSVTLSYDDDGWGLKGDIILGFTDNYILCELKNVEPNSDTPPLWGTYDSVCIMCRYEEIYDENGNPLDPDYEPLIPEESTEPTYDTSKASGILASLGMTEQEFRNSCAPLTPSTNDNIYIKKDTTVPFVELYDIERNPNAYIGQHFYFAENPYEWLPCDKCGGTGTLTDENDIFWHGYECPGEDYADSSHISTKNGVHCVYKLNLNKVVPYDLLGRNRYTNSYGESIISGDDYIIVDLRDDIYSPNITEDSKVIAYMIFNGISNSGDYLVFSMISCDVIYDD